MKVPCVSPVLPETYPGHAHAQRATGKRLYLINPCNALVSIVSSEGSRWNRYRVWKPLGLMVLALSLIHI